MRNIITKISRWVLAAMGFAAVSGCDGEGGFMPAPEYGVPHASFEVKCTMVDSETGAPVKGVKMATGDTYTFTDENGEAVTEFYEMCEGTERENGVYELYGIKDIGAGEYDEIHIRLTDPDPAADGHYKDSIYVVPMNKIKDKDKNDNWSVGTYGTEVTLEAEQVK